MTEENDLNNPPITVSSRDFDRLDGLLATLGDDVPMKAALREELSRADVVEPGAVPPAVVTMNSTVRFRVGTSDREFELTLVYPKDADGNGRTVSVLAPVGSALLGLSTGDEIEWPKPGGGVMKVTIIDVVYQPERAGELHR